MNYRKLTFALLPALAGAAVTQAATKAAQNPRNVIVIITDQLADNMFACDGNAGVKTPNLDRLAARSARFTRSYCANPVSVPSRFSVQTGTYPSVIGMERNEAIENPVSETLRGGTMASMLSAAGIDTYYAGKTHLPGGTTASEGLNSPEAYGYMHVLAPQDKEGRDPAAQACADFIRARGDKPFFFFLSLINPHDICYLPIYDHAVGYGKKVPMSPPMRFILELMPEIKEPVDPAFAEANYPALPPNYGEKPEDVKTGPDHHAGWTTGKFSDWEWMRYRYLYDRLIEVIDRQVGMVTDALRESGLDGSTLLIFTSDHGEMNGAHRRSTKGVFYEEATRIPLLLSWPGHIEPGKDATHIVSNGLDLGPTVLDYKGVAPSKQMIGRSVRPLLEEKNAKWREGLVVENGRERILVFDNWKYVINCKRPDMQTEQLYDLRADPGEMNDLAASQPAVVERARKMLAGYYPALGLRMDPMYGYVK